MTKERLIELFQYYRNQLSRGGKLEAQRAPSAGHWHFITPREADAHILFVCDEAIRFVQEGRVGKARLRLGFIQGYFWRHGYFTLDQFSKHNHEGPNTDHDTEEDEITPLNTKKNQTE